MPENIVKNEWQCRWSKTLGNLEDNHQNVWGTKEYLWNDKPTVFMGVYSFHDFYAVWAHRGRRCILWCGGDILRLTDTGYWLADGGALKLDSQVVAKWINENCENYCENEVEQKALKEVGVEATIIPSFLGNVEKYEVSFKPGNKVYASVSGDNFEQYGWPKIEKMAKENKDIEFHLYGNTQPWKTRNKNVIVHGRVDKEVMNAEIKEMQGGIRLLEFDGFSEIVAKSVLWGQYPIAEIEYPYMLKPGKVREILDKKTPNFKGREYYKGIINNYPWNIKKHGKN